MDWTIGLPLLLALLLATALWSACGVSPPPSLPGEVPRISVEELKSRLSDGEEIVIGDSRGRSSYDVRHIANAVSIPLADIENHLDDLAPDQAYVLYYT